MKFDAQFWLHQRSTWPSAKLRASAERLAEEVYDRLVRPALGPEDNGKYVAVAFEADVTSGRFCHGGCWRSDTLLLLLRSIARRCT